MNGMQRPLERSLLFVAVATLVFFSTYKLTESPPPWRDEGIVTQVARNLSERGRYAVQLAPGEFVSAGFVTTGYPVIFPVALSFKLFGAGLPQARAVMILFIFSLALAAYFLMRRESGSHLAAFSLLLLAGFAPLYGHGRTVIGEVPGTALILLLLLFIRSREERDFSLLDVAIAGLLVGLVMAAKPIFFIVGVPTLVIAFFLSRSRLSGKRLALFCLLALACLALWLFLQFGGESLAEIARIYSGDPDRVSIFATAIHNVKDMLTHLETLYFMGLMVLWALGLYISRKEAGVSQAERGAFVFSIMLSGAYLASVGYYRYFFPAEALALLYLPLSLSRLSRLFSTRNILSEKTLGTLLSLGLIALSLFQFYQTGFKSFISSYFTSRRTALLSENLSAIGQGPVLVWDVPEAVLFLPNDNYYQYVEFATAVRGKEQLPELVAQKIPSAIVIPSSLLERAPELSRSYTLAKDLGKYVILGRKP